MSPQIEQGDIEQELRELFREKVGEAPVGMPDVAAAAPRQVLRRGRRRQVATIAGSATIAFAIVIGSVAGLQSILRSDPNEFQTGPPGYDVFERVATVEAFTLGSPSDWFLVNEWPLALIMPTETNSESFSCVGAPVGEPAEPCNATSSSSSPIPQPYGLPMLQLSNLDVGLDSIACRDGLPNDAAVLYIAMDPGGSLAPDNASLPPYPIGPGLPDPVEAGPCGPGTYAHFTVNGTPMFFWIGVGDGATDADRETVRRTAEMMYADDGWEPSQPNHATPAYVIAGGSHGPGDPWRLELRYLGDSLQLSIEDGPAPQVLIVDESAAPVTWTGADPIFGAVVEGATGVEFRSTVGDTHLPGTIVPVPPSIDAFDLDLFFIDAPDGFGEPDGDVFVLGVEPEETSSAPPAGEPRAETVEFSGTLEGHDWAVSFRGSFADRTACIYVDMDAERQDPLCPTDVGDSLASGLPSMHGWLTSFHLLGGSVPLEIVEIRFVGDDDAVVPQSFHCEMGPLGWTDPDVKVCALSLPASGSGTVQYLDSGGSVVSEEGIAWGVAEPEMPTPVEPVHGGTYWAVYPWLGTANGPESNAVVGQLFDDFGVQAYQGDINCDQGAADVVGTEWAWRVAVYFATEEDAQLFAKRADLLNPGPWEPIAQVTTYCLD